MLQKKLFSRPLYIFNILATLIFALPLALTPREAWAQANNMTNVDFSQVFEDPAFKSEFDKLSPAEQQDALKMIDELNNMKPEDWEKVNQMATAMEAELEQRGGLENMSEDDFNQFFNDFATDWENKEKAQEAKPTPEKKKEEKPKKADVKAVSEKEQLLEAINAIIKSLDSFEAKANSIPELAGNIQNWVKNGVLSSWPAGSTWNSIKKSIQSLHQKLELAVAVDQKTNQKKYLDYIFEDKTLVKAITDLKTILAIQEPLVDVHAFGLEPLSKQSKEATKKVLNGLGAAINAGALESAIDKAIAKHEPAAQKSREQEEKARKAAEQESQRKSGMKPAVQTAGTAGSGYSDYGSAYGGGDYYGSDYGDYYGGGDYYSPPAYSRSSSRSSGNMGRESGERGQRSGGAAGARGGKDAKTAKKSEGKEKPKPVIPDATTKQDKNVNTLMARFEENIDRAAELIEDEELAKALEESKPGQAGQPDKAAQAKKIDNKIDQDIEADLAHFITTAASSINELYYNVTDTAAYKKHIESVMKKPKTKLDPVIKALNAQHEKAEKEYDAQVAKLEAQKKALVMPEGAGEEVEKQRAVITQQMGLIDVQIQTLARPAISGVVKAHNMLNKAIGRFEKTKEKPSTKK
jgi:hypothetical protein